MWILLLLLLFHGAAARAVAEAANNAEVSNEQQLLLALRNQSVTLIVLLEDVVLHTASPLWAGSPVARINRSLTMSGPLPAAQQLGTAGQQLVSLDVSYMRGKVELAPHIRLTIQHLAFLQSYHAWVPGSQFFLYSPGATVRYHHALRLFPACPPNLGWLSRSAQDRQLPAGYIPPPDMFPASSSSSSSGTATNLGSSSDGSGAALDPFTNQVAAINRTECQQQWLYPNTCLAVGLYTYRLVLEVPRQPDRRWTHVYAGFDEMFDSYFPCGSIIQEKCIKQHGFPECFRKYAVWASRMALVQENKGKLVMGVLAAAAAVFLSYMWWVQQNPPGTLAMPAAAARAAAAAARGNSNVSTLPAVVASRQATKQDQQMHSTAAATGMRAATAADSVASLVEQPPETGAAAAAAGGCSDTASESGEDQLAGLQLGPLIGAGSFGRVYKGDWCGLPVAVKVMEVQGHGDLKVVRQELAVNKLLEHPNVVRCLAYRMRQLESPRSQGNDCKGVQETSGGQRSSMPAPLGSSGGGSSGDWQGHDGTGSLRDEPDQEHGQPRRIWTQVLLVLEYCDRGSLHDGIMDGMLRSTVGTNRTNYNNMVSVLRIALDIARGMAHIHSRSVCHGDLCSKNVLLVSSPEVGPPLRAEARVADFGLSRLLPQQGTHLSTLTHGTLTHQAPELLLSHQLRPAADVYSYGVLLWELVHLGSVLPATPPGSSTGSTHPAGTNSTHCPSSTSAAAVSPQASLFSSSSASSAAASSSATAASPVRVAPGFGSSTSSSSMHGDGPAQLYAAAAAAAADGTSEAAASGAAAAGDHGTAVAGTSTARAAAVCTRVYHHLGAAVSPWALMQHVIHGGRPIFTAPAVPGPYVNLAQRCWQVQPEMRPSFAEIVKLLEAVMQETVGAGHGEDLLGTF